jgi:hypothetical protein
MTQTGSCLCGGVSVTGHGTIGAVSICHCPQCLKHGAGPYMGVRFSDGIDFGGETLAWFESSAHAMRGFCQTCGSTVAWKMQGGDVGSVNVHLFDDTNGLTVREEIFIDTPPDWYFSHAEAPRMTRAEALAELNAYLAKKPGEKS